MFQKFEFCFLFSEHCLTLQVMLKDVADSKRINTHITDQRAKAERLREEQKAKDPVAAESQENEPQVITFTQTCC